MANLCEHYHHLDLAWLRRRKLLTPGTSSSINWTMAEHPSGSILIEVGTDAVHLIYRTRSPGEDWQDMREVVRFWGNRHSVRRPPALVRLSSVRQRLQGVVRWWPFPVPELSWPAVPVAVRVRLEQGHQPRPEAQDALARICQPHGTVPSPTQAHAPSDLPQAPGTR
jgi:hypothetical protein